MKGLIYFVNERGFKVLCNACHVTMFSLFVTLFCCLGSCSDFFDIDNDYIIYADKNHLVDGSDSLFSFVGVLKCLVPLVDRTVLLGEVRGDLVDITDASSSDLRDLSLFSIGDDNVYNVPRSYYEVINNCNYFIANADTSLRNNRNERVFLGEYVAIKAWRAWTYLQLVLNYGSVPFVVDPILTERASLSDYERKGIVDVCEYFIEDLAGLETVSLPYYRTIHGIDCRLLMPSVYLLLGDLNLWAGHYSESALYYYRYISLRNGSNSTYSTGISFAYWSDTRWDRYSIYNLSYEVNTSWNANNETITVLPGDSISTSDEFSELYDLFNTTDANDYVASLVPSRGFIDLSESQTYCYVDDRGDVSYVPKVQEEGSNGDLRFKLWYRENENGIDVNGNRYTQRSVSKFSSRDNPVISIYRRTLVYLRLAEALNCAGYPRFAFQILSNGVNNEVIRDSVIPYYRSDSTFLSQFDFPTNNYEILRWQGFGSNDSQSRSDLSTSGMMGIHSRGSGFSPLNAYYAMPMDSTLTDSVALIVWQQGQVEDLIVDEGALEFVCEGTRFYDLMRVALRRGDPSYLADRVYARRGEGNSSGISVDLYNTNNWYLRWNNQIGIY